MNLYKDKFQDIQDFYDQYIAMRKVCDELDLHFGRCKDDERAILKENGKTNPTTANFKMAMDKVDEEHQAILFRYKATDRDLETKLDKLQMKHHRENTHSQN